MEWNCNFNKLTNRGSSCNREPDDSEYQVSIPASECGWFNVTPERYRWNGAGIEDRPDWESEQAALALVAEKSKAEEDIREVGSSQLLALGTPYSKEERETWITQESEARAWNADNTANCPMIMAMANTRGIPLALMAQKIIENADLFKQVAGQILGEQQKNLDKLNSRG